MVVQISLLSPETVASLVSIAYGNTVMVFVQKKINIKIPSNRIHFVATAIEKIILGVIFKCKVQILIVEFNYFKW